MFKKRVRNSTLIIILLFIPLIFISKLIRFRYIITDIKLTSGYRILMLITGQLSYTAVDPHFQFAAKAYENTNFLRLNTFFQFEVVISIFFNLILIYFIRRIKKSLKLLELLFVLLSIAVLNMFVFGIAKEPVQMVCFILVYLVLSGKMKNYKKLVFSMALITICALTFRFYYALIVIFVMALIILLKIFNIKGYSAKKKIILIVTFFITLYVVMIKACQVLVPNYYYQLINVADSYDESANTAIKHFFDSSNILLMAVDYFITFFRMLFPIELITKGIQCLPYIFFQLTVTVFLIRAVANIQQNDTRKNLSLFIFLGFLYSSVAFEPDFGSWIRHESVTFPLFMYIADLERDKLKHIRFIWK